MSTFYCLFVGINWFVYLTLLSYGGLGYCSQWVELQCAFVKRHSSNSYLQFWTFPCQKIILTSLNFIMQCFCYSSWLFSAFKTRCFSENLSGYKISKLFLHMRSIFFWPVYFYRSYSPLPWRQLTFGEHLFVAWLCVKITCLRNLGVIQ